MSFDFNIWYNTPDPNFVDLNIKSRVPYKWINFSYVLNDPIWNKSIIKPINGYVKNFGIMPELVSIDQNIVRLRQRNHAEIFLLNTDNGFINRDRPWMRQYYNTESTFEDTQDCYPNTYKFYVPWIIDDDVLAKIVSPDEESPFSILPQEILFRKIGSHQNFINPDMVLFHFKRFGSHMIEENYGRIKIGSPMFDIVFKASNDLVLKIKEIYEKD